MHKHPRLDLTSLLQTVIKVKGRMQMFHYTIIMFDWAKVMAHKHAPSLMTFSEGPPDLLTLHDLLYFVCERAAHVCVLLLCSLQLVQVVRWSVVVSDI